VVGFSLRDDYPVRLNNPAKGAGSFIRDKEKQIKQLH